MLTHWRKLLSVWRSEDSLSHTNRRFVLFTGWLHHTLPTPSAAPGACRHTCFIDQVQLTGCLWSHSADLKHRSTQAFRSAVRFCFCVIGVEPFALTYLLFASKSAKIPTSSTLEEGIFFFFSNHIAAILHFGPVFFFPPLLASESEKLPQTMYDTWKEKTAAGVVE